MKKVGKPVELPNVSDKLHNCILIQ